MGNITVCRPNQVFKGTRYRISVLSERLIRLEYNVDGVFVDQKTELVCERNFPQVDLKVTQDSQFIHISTSYFIP